MTLAAPHPVADVAIDTTRTACAGAAAAYGLKRIAGRAGSYAPGIDEGLFFELTRDGAGLDLARVAAWFATNDAKLSRLGYRIGVRLVAFRTEVLVPWVRDGGGFRAAVVATACQVLHPDAGPTHASAIALVSDPKDAKRVRIVDPWPTPPQLRDVPPNLGEAHARVLNRSLLLYWFGHG